jgi:hypothetical protein
MNIVQMLLARVTPLSEYQPTSHAERAEKRSKRTYAEMKRTRNSNGKYAERNARTAARYRAAWKTDEWLTTGRIEERLGYAKSGALLTLGSLVAAGLLERRPVGGAKLNKRRGYEWRWISPA